MGLFDTRPACGAAGPAGGIS